ncbi:hypothetical protein V8U11_11035 [Pseudomonas chlororaphis]|uniref:AbrB/MazE/SpoVT family DNA-binding domain-containing protein n=1 Tax=Pseudomonas chlororaphis TaxID=587753 RepID=UPI000F5715CE|nr:hypothetical protein [Pseudomonas chlororaphis]
MIFKISKWGHGAAIRLPAAVMAGLDAQIGDVLIGTLGDNSLTLKAGPRIPSDQRKALAAYLQKAQSEGKTTLTEVLEDLQNDIAKQKEDQPDD